MQDFLPFGDLRGDRPDQHAGGEIAENGAKAEPLEERRGDDGAAKQQQGLRIEDGGRGHGKGLRFSKGRGNQERALDAPGTAQ